MVLLVQFFLSFFAQLRAQRVSHAENSVERLQAILLPQSKQEPVLLFNKSTSKLCYVQKKFSLVLRTYSTKWYVQLFGNLNIQNVKLSTYSTLLKSTEEKEDQVILACLKGEISSYLFLLETNQQKRGFFNARLGLCHSFFFSC